MISEYELANIITGATRAEGGVARKSSATILGKAVEDSENGMVRVVPEGDVFAPDGDNTIIIPTSPSVRAGDTVQIGLVGGVSKRPMVVAAGGEGDRQDSSIASAAHAAQVAWNYADSAHTAANQAKTAAQNAQEDATAAKNSATQANTHANSALTQLSIIEDVAGTLDWISKHGTYTLTSDTTVQEGTVYFEKVGNDYIPIAEPEGNPHAQGWYTLDVTDSQSDYIMAHLAVTSAGLWVLPSGIGSAADEQHAAGYKTLLSSTGMTIYDDTGRAVATYGEGITFDSSRALKIGNSNTYIEYYDSNNDEVADSIRIVGAVITLASGKTVDQEITDAVGAIEIGGTNLLRRTGSPAIGDMADGYWAKWVANDTVEKTADGIKITCSGSTTSFRIPLVYEGAISVGETLTLSFDYRGDMTGAGSLYMMCNPAPNVAAAMDALVESTTNWVHFEQTFRFSGTGGGPSVQFMFPYKNQTGKWFEIKDGTLKLEHGNKATDWSPAPEDYDAAIAAAQTAAAADATAKVNAANSQEQLIYCSKASGTSSLSGTTTWVTDVTGGQNKWTLKRPQYSSSYPVLFVATQRKTVGGTVTCTTPQIDETTTVIDGGNIITGTVTANKLNASNINASNMLTVGSLKLDDSSTASAIANSKVSGDIVSMGGQLVVNGSAFLGDNTNFSMFRYDGAKANFSGGSFTRNVGVATVYTDEFIPVDTSRAYYYSFDAMSESGNARTYGCIIQHDIDDNVIVARNVLFVDGSTTTLAQELKNGDTYVYLTSVAGFDRGPNGTDVNGAFSRSLIFWDYANSKGYTYPIETYSRHRSGDGLWAGHSSIDYTNNRIAITAWSGGNVPAGTPVSQGNSGSTYLYIAAIGSVIPTSWTNYAGYVLPPGTPNTGLGASGAFWHGTAKVKVGWLWNYSHSASSPQSQMWVTNVSLAEKNIAGEYYGSCSTPAATTAKAVDVPDLFRLVAGARVVVKFSTASTVAAPTLNVNGTGAKAIWYNNAVASSSNPVLWGANATLNFVYDGTEWVLDEKPPSYSAACSTAAETRDKAATVVGALVVNGTTLTLNFSTANTYASASVRVNLSSTGTIHVYSNSAVTSTTNKLLWAANTSLTFVMQGSAWYLADNGMRKNITHIDDNGVSIHAAANPTQNYLQLDSSEIGFYESGSKIARFKAKEIDLGLAPSGPSGADLATKIAMNGGMFSIESSLTEPATSGGTDYQNSLTVMRARSDLLDNWQMTIDDKAFLTMSEFNYGYQTALRVDGPTLPLSAGVTANSSKTDNTGSLALFGTRILEQTTTSRMGDPVSGYSITRVYTGQGFRVENTSAAVSNDVVTIPISFASDSSITWGNQVAASIDPSIAPPTQLRVFVYARNSWTGPLVPAWISIDNDGSIRINSDAAIVWFGHATYVRKPAGWTAS